MVQEARRAVARAGLRPRLLPAGKRHVLRHPRGRVVDDQLAPAPHRRRDAQRRVSCRTRLHDDQQVHHFGCPPYRQTPDQCRRDDQHLPRLQRDARVPQDRLRPECPGGRNAFGMARLQLLARRNGVPRLGALRVVLQRKEQLVALFQLPEHVPRTRFVPVAERRHVRRHRRS